MTMLQRAVAQAYAWERALGNRVARLLAI